MLRPLPLERQLARPHRHTAKFGTHVLRSSCDGRWLRVPRGTGCHETGAQADKPRDSSDHNPAVCWGSTCRGALQLDKNSARVQVPCHHTHAFVFFAASTSASRGPSCLGRRDRRRPRRGAKRQNIEEYITGSHHASSNSSKACRSSGGRKHWEDQCDNYRRRELL